MISIKTEYPNKRFTGLSSDGSVNFPNRYHCGSCNYGIYFNQASLDERHNRTIKEKSLFQNLTKEEADIFIDATPEISETKYDRFITDFYCPNCDRAIVILWSWREIHMATSSYTPMKIFEAYDVSQ